jgi:hypothetical protein
VGFLVEDKNVRTTLYPSAQEVWDLLAKAAHFPSHVPILVTRRVHYTMRSFALAVGAVSFTTGHQWFSPTIDAKAFQAVCGTLGFRDARRLQYPDRPSGALERFFASTLRGENKADPSKPMIAAYQARWQIAADVCARYADLRTGLSPADRTDSYHQLLEELEEVGLDVSELRAQHRLEHDQANGRDDIDDVAR